MKKLGLIVNPIAGMGGRVGLKGTDGKEALEEARSMGAVPRSPDRAVQALEKLHDTKNEFEILTYPATMGENEAKRAGFDPTVLGSISKDATEARDTRKAAIELRERNVDLLLFAGGDGTARDICKAIDGDLVVLGIPTGVKIHSSIFARSPMTAGELASAFLKGEIENVREEEVMDIDEEAFRTGTLKAKLYGYLRVPYQQRRLQGLKSGTGATESEEKISIAREIVKNMERDVYYVIGPGTTTRPINDILGLDCSLLGVDVVHKGKLMKKDANEREILQLIKGKEAKIVVTPIGGQGYIFGRGNQQISPEVIRTAGEGDIVVISTQKKLNSLTGKPLLVDTGDTQLDKKLSGYTFVITSQGRKTVYPVSY